MWTPNEKISRWRALAEHWSRQTKVPAALILAVIQQESGGNPDAAKYENDFLRNNPKLEPRVREIMRVCGLSMAQVTTSYGLTQLMLTTAWGYLSAADKGPQVITALLDPGKNIRYGAAHLAAWRSKCTLPVKGWDGAVVRYVAGRYNGAGSDSGYARNVCSLWQRYSAWIKEGTIL